MGRGRTRLIKDSRDRGNARQHAAAERVADAIIDAEITRPPAIQPELILISRDRDPERATRM